MSAKLECTFRSDTTKLKQTKKGKGKKEEKSKRKGIKLKKEDSRLSEIAILKQIFFSSLFTIIVVLKINKQAIVAFIFVFHRLSYSILTLLKDYLMKQLQIYWTESKFPYKVSQRVYQATRLTFSLGLLCLKVCI